MIAKPIYEPRGRAKEYADQLAINIYTGCNHGCAYCWARDMQKRFNGGAGFDAPEPRKGIVESVKRQLEREGMMGVVIHLCFTCDPYPAEIDTAPTREVIKAVKAAGNRIQILTKGGLRAERDFDLLDGGDWFGVTFTSDALFAPHAMEPNAAPSGERLVSLERAHKAGIKTWVSCEPVIEPQAVFSLIRSAGYIDLFRIGKMNYRQSEIRWGEFGRECERICIKYGRKYALKADLLQEMNKATGGVSNG